MDVTYVSANFVSATTAQPVAPQHAPGPSSTALIGVDQDAPPLMRDISGDTWEQELGDKLQDPKDRLDFSYLDQNGSERIERWEWEQAGLDSKVFDANSHDGVMTLDQYKQTPANQKYNAPPTGQSDWDKLNLNGDQWITADEYKKVTGYSDHLKLDRATFNAWFEAKLEGEFAGLDKNHDRKIDSKESDDAGIDNKTFKHYAGSDGDMSMSEYRNMPNDFTKSKVMGYVDRNSDGNVSWDEYWGSGHSGHTSSADFTKADVDHDGVLSEAEFEGHARQ